VKKRGKNRNWTIKKLRTIAKKYKTSKDWKKNDDTSYQAAGRLKLLKNKSIVGHLIKLKKPIYKWSKKAVLSDAKKYKWRSKWFKNSQSAYGAAKRNGWFKQATLHMLKR